MAALEANLRREVDEALMLRAQHVEHGITVDQDGALSAAGASPGLADLAPLDEITAPGIYVQDELRVPAATFNEMLARLERVFRRQRDFLADASHELRGPLTVICGNLDLLQMDLPETERSRGAGRGQAHEPAGV